MPSRLERALSRSTAFYERVFSIREIADQRILKWALGAVLLGHYAAFNSWFYSIVTTTDAYAANIHDCWPYFQGCADLLFLRTLPFGYSQPLLYMLLFGSLILSVYFMHRKEWAFAHLAVMPAFLWHTFVSFVLTSSLTGNYNYYLFVFAFIILVLPHKEFFLKASLVLFYALSTVAKMHPSWILGTYFSALETGLPFFEAWSIPVWTNLVIFMELVGAWFLMSRNAILQRAALVFFIAFHLYSGLLVGYRYPSTVLPMLIILFGPLYSYTRPPFDRRAVSGWLLILCLIVLQFTPRLIPGDEKLTLEGNKYGLYMFEANHQCISNWTVVRKDGSEESHRDESLSARVRCDPYKEWFNLRSLCERNAAVARIRWTFDHSINGGPFLRIVDVPDACVLTYDAFRHNAWIKTEYDDPQIVGYPVKNLYD